jgi:GrpB-like predicted nucleotidyltransferase (UPF0157 family)
MKDESRPSYSSEAERRAVALRAAAILQERLDHIGAAADEVERATGIRIVHTRRHILDARRRDLEVLRQQAQAWLVAMAFVDQVMPPGDTRSLGDIAKTLPARELAQLRRALRLAGALNDGGRHDD